MRSTITASAAKTLAFGRQSSASTAATRDAAGRRRHTDAQCTDRRFPKTTYHQRWHAESGFSQHKRRLGSALTARRNASQAREIVLRVLTHNFMLLAEAA